MELVNKVVEIVNQPFVLAALSFFVICVVVYLMYRVKKDLVRLDEAKKRKAELDEQMKEIEARLEGIRKQFKRGEK